MIKVVRLAVAIAAGAASLGSHGMDNPYKYCAISGYFSASEDQFLFGLAAVKQSRVVPNGNDATCLALYKRGREVQASVQKGGGTMIQADMEIINAALDFQRAIHNAVLKASGM